MALPEQEGDTHIKCVCVCGWVGVGVGACIHMGVYPAHDSTVFGIS